MTTHNKAVPARTAAVPGQDDRQMAGSALRVEMESALGEAAQRPTAPDDLVAALTRQSDALEALVAKLDGDWADRLGKVEREVGLLLPLLDREEPVARPAPRGTRG